MPAGTGATPVHQGSRSPLPSWTALGPWMIGWVFFDRLLGVFVLPSLAFGEVSSAHRIAMVGGPGIVWAATGFVSGPLSDRFGHARLASWAAGAAAVLAALSAVAPTPTLFVASRLVGAAAGVTVMVAVGAGLSATSATPGRDLGLSFVGTRLASGVLAPGVAYACAQVDGRLALVVDGLFALGLMVAVRRFAASAPRPAPAAAAVADGSVAVTPRLTRGALLGATLSLPALAVILVVPGLGDVEGSVFGSLAGQMLFGVVASVATLALSLAADRVDAAVVGSLALAVGAAGGTWIALGGHPAIGLLAIAVPAGLTPLGLVLVPTGGVPASQHARATALPRLVAEIGGGALVAPLVVVLAERAGLRPAVGVLAGLLAVAGLAAVAMRAKVAVSDV